MRPSLFVVFLLVVIVGIFALQNQDFTQVKFFKTSWETSKSIILLTSVAVGFFGGIITMLPGTYKRWRKIKALEKELASRKIYGEDKKRDEDNGLSNGQSETE